MNKTVKISGETGYVHEVFGSFQGEGPYVGQRHIFVRLCCCRLNCAYCDTKESRVRQPQARLETAPGKGSVLVPNPLTAERVVEAVLAQEISPKFNDAVCVTGGEPLEQPEFLEAVLLELNGRFRVMLETNGTLPDAFRQVSPLVDIVSMDIKLPSATGMGGMWEKHRDFMELCNDRELIIKLVVSPDTPEAEIIQAARLVDETAPGAVMTLQPVTLPDGGVSVSPARLFQLFSAAKGILNDVRVIPQVHKILGVR